MRRAKRVHLNRLRELGAQDARNRCPICRHPFNQTRFRKVGETVEYCSRDCMDVADERAGIDKAARMDP